MDRFVQENPNESIPLMKDPVSYDANIRTSVETITGLVSNAPLLSPTRLHGSLLLNYRFPARIVSSRIANRGVLLDFAMPEAPSRRYTVGYVSEKVRLLPSG